MMGTIRVVTNGSFPTYLDFEHCAEEGGHAYALQQALEEIVKMLPEAIQLDHQLQMEGEVPPESPFGQSVIPPEETPK